MMMMMMMIVTYSDDDEVKPAPCISEVLLEAVRAHLDDHLTDEDHRERFVHVLEYHLQYFTPRQVHVFNRLITTNSRGTVELK